MARMVVAPGRALPTLVHLQMQGRASESSPALSCLGLRFKLLYIGDAETKASPDVMGADLLFMSPTSKAHRGNLPPLAKLGGGQELRRG